mmetsp:Transcript_14815/g.37511  ORF Transcript_14815/g.37511 Transcript_14815/m.37511 type:complete len:84 (+) Transcript_14815:701-952(+)
MSRPRDAPRGMPVLWATQQLCGLLYLQYVVCERDREEGGGRNEYCSPPKGFLVVASSWIMAPPPGTTTEAYRPAPPAGAGARG